MELIKTKTQLNRLINQPTTSLRPNNAIFKNMGSHMENSRTEVLPPAKKEINVPYQQDLLDAIDKISDQAYPQSESAKESYKTELTSTIAKIARTFSQLNDTQGMTPQQIYQDNFKHLSHLLQQAHCTNINIIHNISSREITVNFLDQKGQKISLYMERHNEIETKTKGSLAVLQATLKTPSSQN